jgi:hypothetical protein
VKALAVPLDLTAPATLTGVGSVPGTDVTDWPTRISDQLDLPHVPELPERGPGADMIGRTLGLLSQVSVEFSATTSVTGWELASATRDMRRARSLLGQDLDAVEIAWQGHNGWAKQQLVGPYTLAAAVERRGRPLLADPGLVRELLEAYRVLVAVHRRDLSRRVPAQWLIQLDEPSLPAVAGGRIATASRLSVLAPVRPELDLGADLLHCCAQGIDWADLRAFSGVLFDHGRLAPQDDAGLAELSENGVALGFGVSPVPGSVRNVLDFFDRTGLTPAPMLISPPCGMVADYRPWQPVVAELVERLS